MFDRFFNSDNVIWIAMGKIFDLFVINLLLLLCSIPLFTIGPALTGFFYVLIQMVRDEELNVTKTFFRSFTGNFRQGIALGVPLTALLAFLALDIHMCRTAGTGIWTFFLFFFSVMFVFVTMTALYVFPILAKFEKSSREILIWAFTLSIRHLPRTLLILLVIVISIFITRFYPGLLFIIFGLVGMFAASQITAVLSPWLPEVHDPRQDDLRPLADDEEEEA